MTNSQVRRGDWHDAARALKAESPHLGYAEISRRVGVTPAAVWKLFNNVKAREWCRRDNAKPERSAAKVVWEREHPEVRHDTCPFCGDVKAKTSDQCQGCADAVAAVRRSLTEGMWAAGWQARDIADALGQGVPGFVQAMRARGWDVPPRRTPEQIERMRAARWGVAA